MEVGTLAGLGCWFCVFVLQGVCPLYSVHDSVKDDAMNDETSAL